VPAIYLFYGQNRFLNAAYYYIINLEKPNTLKVKVDEEAEMLRVGFWETTQSSSPLGNSHPLFVIFSTV